MILVSLTLVCLYSTLSLHAQDQSIRIPAVAPSFVEWSSDGRYLAFTEYKDIDISGFVDDPNWKLYDVQTSTLSSSNGYPFKPNFNTQEAQVFIPDPPDGTEGDTKPKMIFVSPNGRYVVYGGKKRKFTEGESSKSVWKLMLGDRQTLRLVATNLELHSVHLTASIEVLWSQDSRVFVVNQKYATGELMGLVAPALYVSGYADDVSHYTAQPQFDQPVVAGKAYKTITAFSLSADGRYVLLRGREKLDSSSNNIGQDRLILYDAQNNAQTRELSGIDAITVTTARFVANNLNKVFLECNLGLILYDVAAQNWTVINSSFNTDAVPVSLFSPNNEWLAFVDSSNRLYVIRVEEIDLINGINTPIARTQTSTLTNTPTSTPTNTPTNTPTPTSTNTPVPSTLKLQYYPDPDARGTYWYNPILRLC